MIGREIGVHALVEFAVARVARIQRLEAAIQLGQLLLDDVGLDRYAQVIGLAGEVGGHMEVLLRCSAADLKRVVSDVAPQHRRHAQFVRLIECARDFDDLPRGVVAAEVNGRANRAGAEIPRIAHRAEHDLVELVRIGHEFVVVDLDHERNAVRVLARNAREHAEGRGNGIAAALDRKLDDVLAVEVNRVLREARARGMLDALIDGKDREVPSVGESTVAEHRLQAAHHLRAAIARTEAVVDRCRSRDVQHILRHLGLVVEERIGVGAEERLNRAECRHVWSRAGNEADAPISGEESARAREM